MFRQWLFFAMAALPTLVIGGDLAVAAEPSDLPPVDPPGVWHTLTQDDATTDSKCIGNPVTPLCAVETIRACILRKDPVLCLRGYGRADFPPSFTTNKPNKADFERYRVVGGGVVTQSNKASFTVDAMAPETGDVAIQLNEMPCPNGGCYEWGGPPITYLIRRGASGWYAADWNTPRW